MQCPQCGSQRITLMPPSERSAEGPVEGGDEKGPCRQRKVYLSALLVLPVLLIAGAGGIL